MEGHVSTLQRVVVFATCVFVVACVGQAPRDLSELTVLDSVYLDPETQLPYSGPVFRPFATDPDRNEIVGALLDGTWDGELTVYHPNGRVRYMGSFKGGDRCGPWTENADSLPPVNLYAEFVNEVESMAIYPPCEGEP